MDDHSVQEIEKLLGKRFWCARFSCIFVCNVASMTLHRERAGFTLRVRPYYGMYDLDTLPDRAFSAATPHAALALALQEEDPEIKHFEGHDPPTRSN